MTEEKRKYGTHRRVTEENVERLEALGKMGYSFDTALGKLLDLGEDVNRCIEGEEPQTEKLVKLKRKWCKE